MFEIFRKIALGTLLKPKFLTIALVTMIISINLMKLIIKQLPELNKVITELIIYGPSALLVTCLAIFWDSKSNIS